MMRAARRSSALSGLVLLMAVPMSASGQGFEGSMAGWLTSLQQSVSALRIDTRQDSVASEQVSNAGQATAMSMANVIVEQESAIRLREAVGRFETMAANPVTGLCAPVDAETSANEARNSADNLATEFSGYEQRWLEEGGDRSDTLIATHRLRRTVLCSEAESERGLCEGTPAFGVTPAADSDAGPFLARRSYGSAEVDMGSLYVDTLAPLPTIQRADDASSVSELVDRATARRQAALVAIARSGMTDVLLRGVQGGVAE